MNKKTTQVNNEWVLHVDGDGFFAACEVIRKPELRGKPAVVGWERGIATALTYPAKDLGIKRGDPIFKIKKEFPGVPILASHFELYNHYARNLAEILREHVDVLETYSIDECFATLHGDIESVKEKVREIKSVVQKKLGVTYSFGLSVNKTLAKVASKKNKPDGICFLLEDSETLKNTKVENIWGIGWQTARKINNRRIYDAYTYKETDGVSVLKDDFNKTAHATWCELRGEKIFEVGGVNPHQKSLQQTRAFIKKINSKQKILSELSRNVELACGELKRHGLYTKQFSFFVKRAKGIDCVSVVDSFELAFYTQSSSDVLKCIERTFDKYEDMLPGLYRSSGVYMISLKNLDEIPDDLFGDNKFHIEEENKLTSIIDKIKHKHGFNKLFLATSMDSLNNRHNEKDLRDVKDDYIYGLPYPFLGIIKL